MADEDAEDATWECDLMDKGTNVPLGGDGGGLDGGMVEASEMSS
jgi:hypothetical protein